MNAFFDLRIDTVHYRGGRGGVIMSGNCMLSGNRYIASISRDLLEGLPSIREGKIWRLWGEEKECELQFTHSNIVETMIYVTAAQNLSSTYENIVNFIIEEDKVGVSESRELLELFEQELIHTIANNNVESLTQVLPEKTAQQLCNTYLNSTATETAKFLDRLGLSADMAKKVAGMYGSQTVKKIIEDPYRLLSFGISWGEVDHFALTYCQIESSSSLRLQAAIEESLYQACEDGSTVIKLKDLRKELHAVLQEMPLVHKALALENTNGQYYSIDSFYYPAGTWLIEKRIAAWVSQTLLAKNESLFTAATLKRGIAEFEEAEKVSLSAEQKSALKTCLGNNLSLLIGAEDSAKKVTLKCLYHLLEQASTKNSVYRVSLSGMVVSRMEKLSTCTTHTLASFMRLLNKGDVDEAAWIILEEANMVDTVNFFRLIDNLPANCRVLLAGDDKQLTPIGIGYIFQSLAELSVPKAYLEHAYISSESESIPYVLQSIRQGIWRGIANYSEGGIGVSFLNCDNSAIDNNVLALYQQLSLESEPQIICPTQSGSGGADVLNSLIQPLANMSLDTLTYMDSVFGMMNYQSSTGAFTVGDRVVYTKSGHNNELRDGSLGVIVKKLNPAKSSSPVCKVDFGVDGLYSFKAEDLEHLEMAYAITAHRAQGYRFKTVIIPIRKSRLLERSLLYMAISRGVEQIILVGNREAAINAVQKVATSPRMVGLTHLVEDKYK